MRETVEDRRALERKFEKYHNETLANLYGVFKQMADLRFEYHALSAAVSGLETSVARLQQEFRENRTTRQHVLHEVEELRAEASVVKERLGQLEAALRDDHDA